MHSSLKIGRIFGIDVGIHWSWAFIFLIVTWSFAEGVFARYYPQWTTGQLWIGGAFVALIFFVSILLHELSHAVVSNRSGLPVKEITLFVFGGVSNLTREPDSGGIEFKIAIVGPLTSLALAALFAAAWYAIRPVNAGIAGICANLALINAALAVFNMLPGFPLDGGRVFRSIVWSRNHDRLRATHAAARLGEWIAYGMVGLGVIETLLGGYVGGIWLVIIGFFLRGASASSYEQVLVESTLSRVTVSDIMRRDVDVVPPDLSVDQLVHDHILRTSARCFVVMAAGDLAGLVTLNDVRHIPRDQWPLTSAYRAMTPANKLHTVSPDESVTKVLQLMAMNDVNQLPVVRGRELLGMVTRADIMRFIRVRQDLGEEAAEATLPGHHDDARPRADQPPGVPLSR